MIAYIIFFGILIFTIIIHELGHLIMALICGIKVEAFSIGFGKILIHKKIKNIDFRLSLIPFGGYCKLYGETGQEIDGFLNQRYIKKFLVLIAGVIINFITACICYYINYGNILYGLQIDLLFYKFALAKDLSGQLFVLTMCKANWILLQLSLLNIGCAIFNLLPVPALDGGHICFIWLQSLWKEKFIEYYDKMNKISFRFLMIFQIILIYIYWVI
jgi:membrane-associated protease RseP (regulator of RpoE activity)